jgi:hypothetical protein
MMVRDCRPAETMVPDDDESAFLENKEIYI